MLRAVANHCLQLHIHRTQRLYQHWAGLLFFGLHQIRDLHRNIASQINTLYNYVSINSSESRRQDYRS